MKRKSIAFILAILTLCAAAFVGCDDRSGNIKDYGDLPFVDIDWTREGEHDLETIRFGSDGSFRYSCACGNPVNDSDLCEGYSYDAQSKTVTLECIEYSDEMITRIKIVRCESTELHLDFNGEIVVFKR